ncbi:hypothetical protein GH714_022193 [Hevea brasiliensis]|uniref:RNase H type-1 domain-containing protein n=1 Tax=Hevea brasiliensis TaxID=3981 RepID=A0A6A6KWN0_HEVBR|nr:hypothetical protein GH714_022193 [Hevea brasiliensis]
MKRGDVYVLVDGGHDGEEQQQSQGIRQPPDAGPSSSHPPTVGQSDLLTFLKNLEAKIDKMSEVQQLVSNDSSNIVVALKALEAKVDALGLGFEISVQMDFTLVKYWLIIKFACETDLSPFSSCCNFASFFRVNNFARVSHASFDLYYSGPPVFLVKWCGPSPGSFKCNLDAAVDLLQSLAALGCLVRDYHGYCIIGRNLPVRGIVDLLTAEALSWLKIAGVANVAFETDLLCLVQAINAYQQNFTYFGSLISECKALMRELNQASLSFVKRSAN